MAAGGRGLGLVLALVAACGGGGETPSDAGPPDAYVGPCPFPPGTSHVMTQLRYQPAAVGADLDDDGEIDNAIGGLPSIVLASMHDGLDEAIEVGEWMMIFHITGLADPPPATASDFDFHIFTGLDDDVPPDPSDNYGGEGRLYVRLDEFDIDCQSTTAADQVSMTDRVLTAAKDVWSWPMAGGNGTLSLVGGFLELTYDADFHAASGLYAGMTPICSMSQLPFPGETSGSVLDAFANDLEPFIAADMDRDGDGLEQVVGDGETVRECIDGDGTVVAGAGCACDPRIVDAYSLAFTVQLIEVDVIGVK